MKKALCASLYVAASVVFGFSFTSQASSAVTHGDVVQAYTTIAHAKFEDARDSARNLQSAIEKLLDTPTATTLDAARRAWKEARVPYMQTEVYRFGNPDVDDWEGRVNAWPLDEGLIDYVDTEMYGEQSDENPWFQANIIANPTLTIAGQSAIDATVVDANLLQKMHEVDALEANVATGYHAVEFLLWGQDLNGTGSGAGTRPATDFDLANCTHGHCDRRAAYLKAAAQLLVDDLDEMVDAWAPDGHITKELIASAPHDAIRKMLVGMGSLSYGELAGERMKLGLMLRDPEEEHDCFSDNTHASHYYNALGIQSIYTGTYTRRNGRVLSMPGLVAILPKKEGRELGQALTHTVSKMQTLFDLAEGGMAYDQMLAAENPLGNQAIQGAVDALVAQTRVIERTAATLDLDGLDVEGSDSLDAPERVSLNN